MSIDFGLDLAQIIDELYKTHIELWDVVDMKKSDDDKVVALAARNNNRLVKQRSDQVEKIDEIVLQAISQHRYGGKEMGETIGELIEQLGFEKIRIHEMNREAGIEDSPTIKGNELKEKLQIAFNEIFQAEQ